MTDRVTRVLFVCTGNSARSILAEALLGQLGGGRFRAWSAGSHPTGAVNPYAKLELERLGIDPAPFRSKGWDEFAAPGAPALDLVITVCDRAAGEACPAWPGRPATAHWGFPDPARVEGDDEAKRRAFASVASQIGACVRQLVGLPLDELDREAREARIRAIAAPSQSP